MFRKLTSFFGWDKSDGDIPSPPKDVRVQYQKSMYAVNFDDADSNGSPKGVKVGFLRAKIAEIIDSDDVDSILLYQVTPEQRRLNDNDAYLIDYNIMTGDRLLAVLGDKDATKTSTSKNKKKKKKKGSKSTGNESTNSNTNTPRPTPVQPKTPQQKIDEVLESTEKDLGPHINEFIKSPPKDKDARADLHHRLSELVLQKMFLLDDIDVSENQELRLSRKSAINNLHDYHQRLDEAFNDYKD